MSALKRHPSLHQALDEHLIQSLTRSVQQLFQLYFNLTIHSAQSSHERGFLAQGDITGIVSILQIDFEGILAVSLPASLAEPIFSAFLGTSVRLGDREILDGVGEVTNIVYGNLKRDLNDRGFALAMALPTVVVGRNHQISPLADGPALKIRYMTDLGAFEIQVVLK